METILFILKKKEVFMYVRLTFINFLAGKEEEARAIYNNEVVQTVKRQKGNLDCKLLEPIDKGDDYISMTVWDSKENADTYHASGVYKQMVDRVRTTFSKEPVLKVYSAKSVLEPA